MLEQMQQVNELADRVMLLTGGMGARAPFFLRAEESFQLGQPQVRRLAFNVSSDADFYGERLNVFYQYRILNVASALASDLAFRPCDWSSRADCSNGFFSGFRQGNANLELVSDVDGAYQNAAFSVASVFSSPYGTQLGATGPALTLFMGGMDFSVPFVVYKGRTAQLSVTPLYSIAAPLSTVVPALIGGSVKVEFRVVAELSGYKNVRAFQ